MSYQDAFKCQAFKGPLLSVNTHTYVSFKSNCNLDNLYITEQFSFNPSISKISFNIQHECCSAQDHQTPSNYDPVQSNMVSKCASNKLMDGRYIYIKSRKKNIVMLEGLSLFYEASNK